MQLHFLYSFHGLLGCFTFQRTLLLL
uniref:Uncharacterized protein n=1 Tax=Rhizophora mucronata TaxID=61149 RepID=A0A2P2J741_RHIMU